MIHTINRWDTGSDNIALTVWTQWSLHTSKPRMLFFFYTKNRPSQIREISDMTPTMIRIRDVNEFMRAVSVKERILACLSAFIKRALPQSGIGRYGGGRNGRQCRNG